MHHNPYDSPTLRDGQPPVWPWVAIGVASAAMVVGGVWLVARRTPQPPQVVAGNCIVPIATYRQLVDLQNARGRRDVIVAMVPGPMPTLLAKFRAACEAHPRVSFAWYDLSLVKGPYTGASVYSVAGQVAAWSDELRAKGRGAMLRGDRIEMPASAGFVAESDGPEALDWVLSN